MALSHHIARTPCSHLMLFLAFFLCIWKFGAAQVTTLDQLEQQLAAFPKYSLYLEALRAAPNFTARVGDLNNKTFFAFSNSADSSNDFAGGTFPYGLTLARCAINDPSNKILDQLTYLNIVQGKYTMADLYKIVHQSKENNPGTRFDPANTLFQSLVGPYSTLPLYNFNGTIYVNGQNPITDGDLINDPTVSVHGIGGLSLFPFPAGSPNGLTITCTAQANPCNQYGFSICGNQDRGQTCENPSFGVYICHCSPGFSSGGPGTPCVRNADNPAPPPDEGVCGTGEASAYPTRCWFNADPQHRYVCCNRGGCSGFAPPDYLFPTCSVAGYAPPGFGVSASPAPVTPPPAPVPAPPSNPPVSGDQGVCGSGPASAFPTRCYFNSDPQGRYVCCDSNGCAGFNPPNYKFPHCANYGYAPDGYGVSGATSPPSPPANPPSRDQGVCGAAEAQGYPVRCWFNNDPQGRYVCCDNQGCNGFAPPDYLYPRCKNNGYAPPGTT